MTTDTPPVSVPVTGPVIGPVVASKDLPRLGDFESRPLLHAFDPAPRDAAYGTPLFGLVESDFWPYGAVRTESGRWYAYFRTISGRVTTGLAVMGQQDGPLVYDPRSAQCYAGPLGRQAEDDADVYVADAPAPPEAFGLRAGTARVDWNEGPHLQLAGPIAGPGLQMMTAWREPDGSLAHLLHTHLGYEVHGHVFGERAAGYLGLAKAYLPYGLPWQTDVRFGPSTGLCPLWLAFLNVYEDGSSERGMMAYGGPGNRFRFANVVRRDGLELSTDRLEADYQLSGAGFLQSIELRPGDSPAWVFTAEPQDHLDFSGMIPGFSLTPPAGYHVSLGTLRRVGDDRVPTVQVAWVEGFPEAWERPALRSGRAGLRPPRPAEPTGPP